MKVSLSTGGLVALAVFTLFLQFQINEIRSVPAETAIGEIQFGNVDGGAFVSADVDAETLSHALLAGDAGEHLLPIELSRSSKASVAVKDDDVNPDLPSRSYSEEDEARSIGNFITMDDFSVYEDNDVEPRNIGRVIEPKELEFL
jgi:hypothetical protein